MDAVPLVSVVMPVYNGERFLRPAVESILNQTLRDFEFLVVDDGSTDGTAAILAEYAKADLRVKLVRQGHEGLIATLNSACRLASGPYIARMDADDVSLPERLQLQLRELQGHPELGLLGGAVACMDVGGQRLQAVRYPLGDTEIRERLVIGNCLAHPTVVFRKAAFEAAGGYRSAFAVAEDYDLWLRMAERAKLANLAEEVLHYRVHPGQESSLRAVQQAVSVLGARVSARLRRTTGKDPFERVPLVTPELLMSLGVSRAEIGRAVHLRVMGAAAARMAEGTWAAAVPLLAEAERAASRYGLPAADHAATWAMYAAASRRAGLGPASCWWLLRKACRHPWAVAGQVARRLAGGRAPGRGHEPNAPGAAGRS